MPTTRVPAFKCGTANSGWLNGAHPRLEDGEVPRRVCFSDKKQTTLVAKTPQEFM